MNYEQFNAEDLAADDYFNEWVCSPTPETDAFWRQFLKDYPERYYQLEEARLLVVGLQTIQHRPASSQQVDRIWSHIEDTLEESRRESSLRQLTSHWGWRVAASMLLLLGIGWLFRGELDQRLLSGIAMTRTDTENEWVETLNEASQVLLVQLADGSKVELNKGGRLRYKKDLAGPLREVYLTGEAFFEVTKNPKKPFVVYANGLVTKVLGTSFRINASAEAATVTVDVKTGRVSVYPNQLNATLDPESRGIVLMPNQKVVFQRDKVTLNKTLVDSPRLLIPKNEVQQFSFEDASAAQVFGALERAYGVDVIFDEEVMRHCTLTVSLNDEDLFQKLDVICKVLDAEYKLIEAQVVIYSKGCPKLN